MAPLDFFMKVGKMTQDRSTNKLFNTIFNRTLNKHDASQRQSFAMS